MSGSGRETTLSGKTPPSKRETTTNLKPIRIARTVMNASIAVAPGQTTAEPADLPIDAVEPPTTDISISAFESLWSKKNNPGFLII